MSLDTIGLLAAGENVQRDDLSVWLRIKRGLNEHPTVRGEDSIVPGREGRVSRNRIADKLDIELEGWVQPDSVLYEGETEQESFRANVEFVKGIFDPTDPPITLIATLEDGSVLTIDAQVMDDMLWEEIVRSRFANLNIHLVAPTPYWTAGS
jgi:hypothetical protein